MLLFSELSNWARSHEAISAKIEEALVLKLRHARLEMKKEKKVNLPLQLSRVEVKFVQNRIGGGKNK